MDKYDFAPDWLILRFKKNTKQSSKSPYTREFKLKAMRMVAEGRTKREVGKLLKVRPHTITEWEKHEDRNRK